MLPRTLFLYYSARLLKVRKRVSLESRLHHDVSASAIGSIMSIRWVQERAVTYGPYCTVQGVLKQVADVGTACWYVKHSNVNDKTLTAARYETSVL